MVNYFQGVSYMKILISFSDVESFVLWMRKIMGNKEIVEKFSKFDSKVDECRV